MKQGYNCAFSFNQTVTMAGNMIPYENGGEITTTAEDETSTNQNNSQSGFRTFWTATNGDGQGRFTSISITNLFTSNQRNANSYQSFSNRYVRRTYARLSFAFLELYYF